MVPDGKYNEKYEVTCMKVEKLNNFFRGWFIGDFEPAMYRTDKFEVGFLTHKKGEEWPAHYHTGTEINYLVSGRMRMQDTFLESGDVFMFGPYEVANPEFLTDCEVVVVKTPSIPGDKYSAESPKK